MQPQESETDIMLVNPPFGRLMGRSAVRFPISLGYLAGALRRHCSVNIYNMDDALSDDGEQPPSGEKHSDLSYSELFSQGDKYKEALDGDSHPVFAEAREVFLAYRPRILGLTCMSAKYHAALKVAQIYKSCIPDGIVIWGGQHPTIRTDEVLSSGLADFVVRGEGEETLIEMVDLLKRDASGEDADKITGVSFRRDGTVVRTDDRPLISDLDKLGFPGRDLLLKPIARKSAYGELITSRGCPFSCGYCSAKAIWSRKVRYHSIPHVIEEIEMVKDQYGIRDFVFWDDSLTCGRTRTSQLLAAVKQTDIRWRCTTRVDIVDRRLLKEMRQAGCVSIDYGIESGSERMLRKIAKGITKDQVNRAVDDTLDAGIIPNGFFMVGFPDETEEDIRSTIEFARNTKAWNLCLSVFTPYPGTSLYDRAMEVGLIGDDFDWRETSHQSSRNHFTQCVSRERFDSLLRELIGVVDRHNSALETRFGRALALIRNPRGFLTRSVLKLKKMG